MKSAVFLHLGSGILLILDGLIGFFVGGRIEYVCKSGLRGDALKWVICMGDDHRKGQGMGVGSKNGYMFRRTKR